VSSCANAMSSRTVSDTVSNDSYPVPGRTDTVSTGTVSATDPAPEWPDTMPGSANTVSAGAVPTTHAISQRADAVPGGDDTVQVDANAMFISTNEVVWQTNALPRSADSLPRGFDALPAVANILPIDVRTATTEAAMDAIEEEAPGRLLSAVHSGNRGLSADALPSPR
jgi:hypothetical protein